MNILRIKKFDLSTIKNDSVVIVIGRRNCGKSTLVKDILYHKKDFPVGDVVSPTGTFKIFNKEIIPSNAVHQQVTSELLTSIVKRQVRLVNEGHRLLKYNGNVGTVQDYVDSRAFLVLDGNLSNQVNKLREMKSILMCGEYYKLLRLILIQSPISVTPDMQLTTDIVFISTKCTIDERRHFYNCYCTDIFPDLQYFSNVLNKINDSYDFLVINCSTKSTKIKNKVFWYKAKMHQPFTIGNYETCDCDIKVVKSMEF